MATLIFIIFVFLMLFETQFLGSGGAFSDISYAWLLAFSPGIGPISRLFFASFGGAMKGILAGSSWLVEAFAMGLPLLFIERIEKSIFLENEFFRRVSGAGILLSVWFLILGIADFFDLAVKPILLAPPVNLLLVLFFVASSKLLRLISEKILH